MVPLMDVCSSKFFSHAAQFPLRFTCSKNFLVSWCDCFFFIFFQVLMLPIFFFLDPCSQANPMVPGRIPFLPFLNRALNLSPKISVMSFKTFSISSPKVRLISPPACHSFPAHAENYFSFLSIMRLHLPLFLFQVKYLSPKWTPCPSHSLSLSLSESRPETVRTSSYLSILGLSFLFLIFSNAV